MTDRPRQQQHFVQVRDARITHASLPFLIASARRVRQQLAPVVATAIAALLLAAHSVPAQQPRPFLDWRTVETPHFAVHFPERYRAWSIELAERLESVRAQVTPIVGYTPGRRVDVVVDDPINDANGLAYTTLDAPTIVLYPTPPTPREEIGNYRVWGELVATHEFAHVAHLSRPSRNHWQNLLQSLSPVPIGPIPQDAPRWVFEGYATYVEGKVTGTGRPNHAWRAAVLRQWALEGRLPGYGQMSATGGWEAGSFAYLAGSAFIEWLSRREGDSSVTALWRRMTAKTVRSFDEAFIGVYGGSPAQLYGRFVAELTADALTFERAMQRDALVPGTLVQRLARNTGDPAISPDGRFVALVIRRTDAPSKVVVWKTADEPDTLSQRRRDAQLKRDPDDVPDRSFYPPAHREVISLVANDGASYETPRWLSDNKRLLLTRRVPITGGALRPDLYIWSAEDGNLVRVTTGAALRDADPAQDMRWAAAVRCDHGWCDLVRVDLANGAIRVLRAGSPTKNYYRPRVSRVSGEIVVAEQDGDRWRIARVAPETGNLTYADPDDGVTRYDAAFEPDGRSIVATSERGGIANIERLSTERAATRVTSVTGAAVAPDVAPDGTIWFLSLHANGYDLMRLRPDSASIARARNALQARDLALVDAASPVLPPRLVINVADSARRPIASELPEPHAYGFGPSRFRYVPSLIASGGGTALQLALVRSDPVGRFGVALIGSAGAGALPTGLGLDIRSRRTPTTLIASAWASHEAPSSRFADAYALGLDLGRIGGAARAQRLIVSDGGEMLLTAGALGEQLWPSALNSVARAAVLGSLNIVRRQRDDDTRYQEMLASTVERGLLDGEGYLRQRSTIGFGTGSGGRPLSTIRVSYGSMGGRGADRERFALGGFASPLIDPQLDARRVEAPAYPVGSAAALNFASYRVAVPLPPVELFYAAATPDLFGTSLRSYGAELRERVAGIPALGTPDLDLLAGFARALDEPVRGEWRYYLSVGIRP